MVYSLYCVVQGKVLVRTRHFSFSLVLLCFLDWLIYLFKPWIFSRTARHRKNISRLLSFAGIQRKPDHIARSSSSSGASAGVGAGTQGPSPTARNNDSIITRISTLHHSRNNNRSAPSDAGRPTSHLFLPVKPVKKPRPTNCRHKKHQILTTYHNYSTCLTFLHFVTRKSDWIDIFYITMTSLCVFNCNC